MSKEKQIIKIDDNYTIEIDSICVYLRYEYVTDLINKKTGKPIITKKHTYHPNIKEALKYYVNDSINYADGILDILKRLDEIEKKILNLQL